MFSLVLHPGRTHTVEISTPLNLTNIAFGEEVVGAERSVVKIRYFYADDDDELEVVGEESGRPTEAVIAALIPAQVEQFTTSIVLTSDVDYVELSCTGQNTIHLIGHYLPDLAPESADGPLDGPDSDASSDEDWNLEDELSGGEELELPPSLLAVKAQNDAFDLEQAYKLLAEEDAATKAAKAAVEDDEHAYDEYVYAPPQPPTSAPAFLALSLPSSDDEDDSAFGEDAEMDDNSDSDEDEDEDDGMESDGIDSEDEHELDILDMQRQAAGELKGIQQVMLQNRLAAARKLVAAHEAKIRGEA